MNTDTIMSLICVLMRFTIRHNQCTLIIITKAPQFNQSIMQLRNWEPTGR